MDTYYTYNFRDQLTQVSMTRGGVTQLRSWNYDRATGQLNSVTQPETGTVSYTYNSDGTVNDKTDASGDVTAYVYDTYKRVTQVTVNGYAVYTYTYDADPFGGGYPAGRLSTVSYLAGSNTVTEKYGYTKGGLVSRKRLQVQRSGKLGSMDVDYTYDSEGRMTSIKQPEASGTSTATYTYAFDTLGRANKLSRSSPAKVYVKDVLYGPAGEMTQIKTLDVGGCLTALGVSARNHSVSFSRIQIRTDGEFQLGQWGMSLGRQVFAESGAGCGELIQCRQSVAQHGMQVELARRLIESPQSFCIVGIQFEQLPEEALWNLWRRQIHAVQGAEKRQQVQSRGFQTRAQVRGNFLRCTASHSIEHPAGAASGQYSGCRKSGHGNHGQTVQQSPVVVQQQQA